MEQEFYTVNKSWITHEEIDHILNHNVKLKLGETAKSAIDKCRAYLDEKVQRSERLIYGVNTGFGSLCNTAITNNDLEQLQRNLVLSHACGTGDEVPSSIVRRMMLLKILGLSHGHSGVQLATVERLIFFFNENIIPLVYQQGSLGASGDLAPLAHLSLPLLGEGKVYFKNEKLDSREVLTTYGLEPIILRSKEGLALLGCGTGVCCMERTRISASLCTFTGSTEPSSLYTLN